MNKNKNFLSGKFLIASPSMLDPVFYKSVIYLISHRSEGAMGIVINQPIVQTKLENIIRLPDVTSHKTVFFSLTVIPKSFEEFCQT